MNFLRTNAKTICVHLKISGRVQGVYYRASMPQAAQQLGLTGWVMNCDDGSVIAVAEGPREQIEKLIAWCGHGPAGARVASVNVDGRPPQNDFRGFTIKR